MEFLKSDGDFDTSIPVSAVAMQVRVFTALYKIIALFCPFQFLHQCLCNIFQRENEDFKCNSVGAKPLPAACSTPTLTTSSTSRKLFDGEINEPDEPDTQIDR